MRKIAATYVFPISQPPIKNGIFVCENDGTVVEIIDNGDNFRESAGVEFYSGILVPGFVQSGVSLLNRDKVFSRKMWAAGISLLIDSDKSLFSICETSDFKTNELHPGDGLRSANTVTNTSTNSILDQLLNFQVHNESATLTDVFRWASLEGAMAFGFESKYGSFEEGKMPGVNLITGIDFRRMKLTANSKIKRLL